jgi:hypothetical protein
VRKYFQIMSSGNLDYSNEIVGPITLSKDRKHYMNESMLPEVLSIVDDMVDMRQFDYDQRQ